VISIKFNKKKMYLYRYKKTGEILLSEEKVDEPDFIFIGDIEVDE